MGSPKSLKKPDENIGMLLWQTNMLWQRKMNQALKEINLTHTQFVVLASLGWLLKQGKVVAQKDIADFSKTDQMMVSKVFKNA